MKYPKWKAQAALCTGVAFALPPGCASSRSGARAVSTVPSDMVVALTTVSDLAPVEWRGLSNVFLDSLTGPSRDSVRMPESWTAATLDDMVGNSELQPVRVLRFRTAADTALQFAVDTVGDLNFTHAPVVAFTRQGKVLVANIDLTVRTKSGSSRRLPYQILRSDDRYTYVRIAAYQTGQLDVDGTPYPIRVRSLSRNHPFYGPNPGTVFLVDMNRDGKFAEVAALTVDGRPVAAEQALAFRPFELAGRFYEISAIDSAGTALRIRASTQTVAVAENRRAPELRARPIAGGEFQLSKQTGKVVMISFWATDCVYSERVRSAANDLVTKYGAPFTWVAMAKDTNLTDLKNYLAKSPIHGTATMPDSSAWATCNPMGVTPLFVVVDQRGIVRFHAQSATAMGAVAAKIDELLAEVK